MIFTPYRLKRIREASINPLLTLDIPHLKCLVAIPEFVVIHESRTLVGRSLLIEFGPTASTIRAAWDLSKYLPVRTFLGQLGLITCSRLIIKHQQLLK